MAAALVTKSSLIKTITTMPTGWDPSHSLPQLSTEIPSQRPPSSNCTAFKSMLPPRLKRFSPKFSSPAFPNFPQTFPIFSFSRVTREVSWGGAQKCWLRQGSGYWICEWLKNLHTNVWVFPQYFTSSVNTFGKNCTQWCDFISGFQDRILVLRATNSYSLQEFQMSRCFFCEEL